MQDLVVINAENDIIRCDNCGTTYNVLTNPPYECEYCGDSEVEEIYADRQMEKYEKYKTQELRF